MADAPAHDQEIGSRQSRGEATRERIMAAAARLFSEQGYDATSVETIALAAGIAAPSIYKHFPTKHAVLLAVADRATRTSRARRALSGSPDLPAELADLFAEYLAVDQVERRRLSIELSRAAFQNEELAAALAGYNAMLRRSLQETVHVARPDLAGGDDEAALVAHLLLVLLMGAVHLDTLDAERIGDPRLIEFLRDRFTVMLSEPAAPVADDARRSGSATVAEPGPPEPVDGRKARAVRTRRRIMDAAAELFALHGYDATTTEMIAAKAGITVPGMYRHVDSKQDLLVAVGRRAFAGYRLVHPLGGGVAVADDLADLLGAFSGSGDRVSRRLAIELDFGAWRSPALADALRAFHRDVRANVARALLADAVADDEEQADLAAMVVLMLFMGTAHLDTVDPSLLDDPAWTECLHRRLPQLIGRPDARAAGHGPEGNGAATRPAG